ncbi:hypothetical protein FBY35_1319 [Streptomyces sp. SLBN-118]|uniref:hypothetical protein n=1 Tax=Streptomyces sp. SLBN-118 TaxID=2768454 RepID=UPI001153AE79|nr:hypothetical protein [Streptomyces sp. SLBN-118]TQK50943.1 hypothetical protein FBY35_1319 [Streptomyces sp. SLBN-118]
MRLAARMGTLAAAGSMLAGTLLIQGAAPANAAGITFSSFYYGNGRMITAYIDGNYAATAEWVQDPPAGGGPGDNLCVTDDRGDGFWATAGISANRSVSSKGKPSPSRTCKGGDLPEDHTFVMKLCVTNGARAACSKAYDISS